MHRDTLCNAPAKRVSPTSGRIRVRQLGLGFAKAKQSISARTRQRKFGIAEVDGSDIEAILKREDAYCWRRGKVKTGGKKMRRSGSTRISIPSCYRIGQCFYNAVELDFAKIRWVSSTMVSRQTLPPEFCAYVSRGSGEQDSTYSTPTAIDSSKSGHTGF